MEGRGNDRPLEAGSASYRGSLRCANSPGTIAHGLSPRGKKGGCDRPVLARLIMLLRSLVSCGPDSPALRRRRPRSAKHPGRPRRAERRTEFAVSLGSLPGWIAGSLYLLPYHVAERPQERKCLLKNLFLTSKFPWKLTTALRTTCSAILSNQSPARSQEGYHGSRSLYPHGHLPHA